MARKKKETYSGLFAQLCSSLDEKTYSLFNDEFDYVNGRDEEVRPTDYIVTITDFGSCGGIYIYFMVKRDGEDRIQVGTAKTLSYKKEDYIRMHERAARMTLVLNDELAKRYKAYYEEEIKPKVDTKTWQKL